MKDPAVLFYTSDFITGTLTMTDEQRGKYIMLLCIQHQQGYLTKEDMLNICKTYDEKVFKKFDEIDGLFYNIRMKNESERRKRYCESRSSNRKSYVKHMETETNSISIKKRKRSVFKKPVLEEVIKYFTDNGYTEQSAIKAFKYYDVANWFDSNGKEVKNWKQKMQIVWFTDENKDKKKEPLKLAM
jgi:uncharacterized protein YdaU (DUF1376 family)